MGAVRRAADDGDGRRIERAVGIAVIGQHVDRDGLIGIGRGAVVQRDRRIVRRAHRQRDGGLGRGRAFVIVDRVGQAVATLESAIRGVGDAAIGIDVEGAIGRSADDGDSVGIERAIGIAVIGQHVDRDGLTGIGRGAVIEGEGGDVATAADRRC